MELQRIGVIGAGTMGNGIAQISALAGFDVMMIDVDDAALQRGRDALLRAVQQDLFDLGGELSIPGYTLLHEARVLALDHALDDWNAALPRLEEFIMPGGTLAGAQAHVCRTVARRAERAVVALAARDAINAACLQYLNRLSDLLFVLARTLNRSVGEQQWQHDAG